jgi:hypothetical protein
MTKSKTKITNPLWELSPSGIEVNIPVLGLAGEFESGKTIFAVTIAPGLHPVRHKFEMRPRTLVIDVEMSSATYESSALCFDRVDLIAEAMKKHPQGYNEIDLYDTLESVASSIQDGQYDVIILDPATDIDAGMLEYVKRNCKLFGLTTGQVDKMPMLVWAAVKSLWQRVIMRFASKCKTFVFTAHLKDDYIGTLKTGKRIPKGKETLEKLATLYLLLERKPDKGIVPSVPNGIRLKSRISDIQFLPSGKVKTTELIPKSFKNATPETIRGYISSASHKESLEYNTEFLDNDMRLVYGVANNELKNQILDKEIELKKYQEGQAAAVNNSHKVVAPIPPQTSPQIVHEVSNEVKEFAGEDATNPNHPNNPLNNTPFDEAVDNVPFDIPGEEANNYVPPASNATTATTPVTVAETINNTITPESFDIEHEIENVKRAVASGLIPPAWLQSKMIELGCEKVSAMPKKEFLKIIKELEQTKKVFSIAKDKGVPKEKLYELAATQYQVTSVFAIPDKTKILEFLQQL